MKRLLLASFVLCAASVLLIALSGVAKPATTARVQLIPTSTPTLAPDEYIYAVLADTNALLICYVKRQPIPDVFLTATAIGSPSPTPTPTSTTVSLATKTVTPIWITPQATGTLPTPTIEFWQVETLTAGTPQPITLTVLSTTGLNVRQCAVGLNPSTACPVVRVAGSGTYVNTTGETYEASTITWRKLVTGEWIAEIINDVRVLGQ